MDIVSDELLTGEIVVRWIQNAELPNTDAALLPTMDLLKCRKLADSPPPDDPRLNIAGNVANRIH